MTVTGNMEPLEKWERDGKSGVNVCMIARAVVQGNGFEDVQTEEVIF